MRFESLAVDDLTSEEYSEEVKEIHIASLLSTSTENASSWIFWTVRNNRA